MDGGLKWMRLQLSFILMSFNWMVIRTHQLGAVIVGCTLAASQQRMGFVV